MCREDDNESRKGQYGVSHFGRSSFLFSLVRPELKQDTRHASPSLGSITLAQSRQNHAKLPHVVHLDGLV